MEMSITLYINRKHRGYRQSVLLQKRQVDYFRRRSNPVARTAGNCFPHFLADLLKIIVDWKFFAAHRAAKCYHASADSKLDLVITFLAIHILHSA